jgi:hypothetical protein
LHDGKVGEGDVVEGLADVFGAGVDEEFVVLVKVVVGHEGVEPGGGSWGVVGARGPVAGEGEEESPGEGPEEEAVGTPAETGDAAGKEDSGGNEGDAGIGEHGWELEWGEVMEVPESGGGHESGEEGSDHIQEYVAWNGEVHRRVCGSSRALRA